MDDLIIRSLMGETSAEEERQLIRWRAADPRNDAWYRSLAATWELAGHPLEPEEREPPSARSIIERAERRPAGPATPTRRERGGTRRRPRAPRWLAAAAALAAIAVGTTLWRGTGPGTPVDELREVATEEARTVRLADGSAAHLAPGTVLERVPGDSRRVRLDGRAYFGIAHEPDRPFIVETGAGRTRVLGTRFDLTARGGDMTVVVVEGRVEVETDSGEVEIGPGEASRVVDGRRPVVGRADVTSVTEWLGNVFIFQSTPLEEVRRELEERFGRTIVIEDAALKERTVTAVFSEVSLDQILPALCRAVDARCTTTDQAVRIAPEVHT